MDLSTCVSLRKLMQAYAGWVMLGQVRVMLGQVGSCWDRSESCLCVTTFWPVPYCDFVSKSEVKIGRKEVRYDTFEQKKKRT